jgi:hypothetical protein
MDGVINTALDELRNAGYTPADFDEAVAAAQDYLGCSRADAVMFVTGQGDRHSV